MSERDFLIFVLPYEINEPEMEYADVISWANTHLENNLVMRLSLDDVYLLDASILHIVNAANDSMIGPWEDSWIHDGYVKQSILQHLEMYEPPNGRESELLAGIINLLRVSIANQRNLYFWF